MKVQIGSGQLKEWFEKATEEELVFLWMMNPSSIDRLCVLLTLELQLIKEKKEQ